MKFRNPVRDFKNPFNNKIGVDLGTANTVFATTDGRVLFDQPTLAAINHKSSEIEVFFGEEAQKKRGNTSSAYEFVELLKDGTIQHERDRRKDIVPTIQLVEGFLAYAFGECQRKLGMSYGKPDVVAAVSCVLEERDHRSLKDAFHKFTNNIDFVFQPVAMLSSNPEFDPMSSGTTISVDIGHGTTDYVCRSQEDTIHFKAIKTAGSEMTQAIIDYVLERSTEKGCPQRIDEYTAARIKHQIGCAMVSEEGRHMPLRMISSGGFVDIPLTDEEVCQVLQPMVNEIVNGLTVFMSELNPSITTTIGEVQTKNEHYTPKPKSPPQLTVYLGGGGSLTRNIGDVLEQRLKLNVVLVEKPLTAAAIGAARFVGNEELLKRFRVTLDDVKHKVYIHNDQEQEVIQFLKPGIAHRPVAATIS